MKKYAIYLVLLIGSYFLPFGKKIATNFKLQSFDGFAYLQSSSALVILAAIVIVLSLIITKLINASIAKLILANCIIIYLAFEIVQFVIMLLHQGNVAMYGYGFLINLLVYAVLASQLLIDVAKSE